METSRRKMQSALFETLADLEVRGEVEKCMSTLLVDLETTFSLQQQLVAYTNQQSTDRLVIEQKSIILDAEAERLIGDQQRENLADTFVQELMTMSRELETLLHWKKQNEHKVDTYDELLAKLAQAEEELEAINRIPYGGEPKERQPSVLDNGKSSPISETTEDNRTTQAVSASEIQEKTEESDSVLEQDDNIENRKVAATNGKPVKDGKQDLIDPAPVEEHTPSAAVVSIDEEETEEDAPTFAELDMEILMNIFGYLDPVDILNAAQVNIAMYTRGKKFLALIKIPAKYGCTIPNICMNYTPAVDTIFGIADDGVPQPQPAAAQKPTAPPHSETHNKPKENVVTQPALTAAANSATAAAPPATNSAPGTESTGKGLFSMLQPRSAPGRVAARTGRSQQMNASLAKSMASKLTDAELAAILSMTDRLSKLEKEVNLLRNENEGLAAKLDGTEAVKQFLISKCRDVEFKLKQREEDDVKVTQQIASDQEVIAFLDSRIQELEMSSDNVTKEMNSARTELNSLKVSSTKKTTMLNDMLKYEREKLREEETDWKATKKVLVKEVKSCRAQILALQAERDGYKEQNEMLKRAIVSTGKNANLTSPNR